jgi:hypothetical protein
MAIPQPVIEQIVALAAAGLSRAMIAEQVGITRNAICGLLHRRGIRAAGAPRISKPRRSSRPPKRRAPAPTPRCAPAEIVGVIRPAVPLTELSDDGCHWPVSWGEGRATLFCNHGRAGSGHPSYCRQHAMRAIRTEAEAVEASRLRRIRSHGFWFGIALSRPGGRLGLTPPIVRSHATLADTPAPRRRRNT